MGLKSDSKQTSAYVGKGIMTLSKEHLENGSVIVSYFSNDSLDEQSEFQLYTDGDGKVHVNVSISHSKHSTIGVPLEVFHNICRLGEQLKDLESKRKK